MNITLTPPTQMIFIISVIIAALTVLGQITLLPFFSVYGYGLLLIAYVLLAAGVLVRNL